MNEQTTKTVIIVCLVILAVILIGAVIARLFRLAAVILVLAFLVPILISIMSGNGATRVEKISSIFTPEIQQQINETYKEYSELEKEDPVLDEEGFKEALGDLWEKTKDSVSGAVSGGFHFSDEPE